MTKRVFFVMAAQLIAAVRIASLESTAFADDIVIHSRSLPSLPDTPGVASPFAGLLQGQLVVAGGANFPTAPPWKGGKKVWHDTIYRLDDAGWSRVGQLPHPIAYGTSFQTSDGILCVGGSDAFNHFHDVFLLSCQDRKTQTTRYPALPVPVANACGTIVGTVVVIAGGTDRPDSTTALNSVFALDLSADMPMWRRLPDIPGEGRMLSVAAATSDTFFLFSGASLSKGSDGKPSRTYLKEAWKLELSTERWTQLPDMPASTVAAPSPAAVIDGRQIIIFGGDDGTLAGFQPPDKHPGFRSSGLVFDLHTNVWTVEPELPVSRVTVPLVSQQDRFLLPSGEIRPGVRSPEVFELRIEANHSLK